MKRKISYRKVFIASICFLIFGCVVATGIKIYMDFFWEEKEVVKESIDTVELYGYTLNEEDNEIFIKYFNELKEVLNEKDIEYKEYASLLVKLFVIDFYTLNNKITSTDIGGLEFVYEDMIENFKIHAGDTMYNTIESNINGNREQELPEVSDVSIDNVEETTFVYNEIEYEGYEVTTSWNYVNDLGYDNSGKYILIKANNKLNVVEGGYNE